MVKRREALTNFWGKVTASPPATLTAATNLLQGDASNISDAQGDAFFNVVAQVYNDIGLTAQNTYTALCTEIRAEGESASNTVFDRLVDRLVQHAEVVVVAQDLLRFERQTELDGIPAKITTIETARDAEPNRTLKDAFDAGIAALNRRADELRSRPGIT